MLVLLQSIACVAAAMSGRVSHVRAHNPKPSLFQKAPFVAQCILQPHVTKGNRKYIYNDHNDLLAHLSNTHCWSTWPSHACTATVVPSASRHAPEAALPVSRVHQQLSHTANPS